jgi:hypothetical protein
MSATTDRNRRPGLLAFMVAGSNHSNHVVLARERQQPAARPEQRDQTRRTSAVTALSEIDREPCAQLVETAHQLCQFRLRYAMARVTSSGAESFYALCVGRGFVTTSAWSSGPTRDGFYALCVGRGFVTGAGFQGF